MEDVLSLDTAYKKAQAMEVSDEQAGHLQQAAGERATETVESTGATVHKATNSVVESEFRKKREKARETNGKATVGPHKISCWRCGKANHTPGNCYFKSKDCLKCKKTAHTAKMCRSGTRTARLVEVEQ